jgi:hypothetical protein
MKSFRIFEQKQLQLLKMNYMNLFQIEEEEKGHPHPTQYKDILSY